MNTKIFEIPKNFVYRQILKKMIMKKTITLSGISIENLKTLKYHISKKYFEKKNQLKY